jgi:hypothetical protein
MSSLLKFLEEPCICAWIGEGKVEDCPPPPDTVEEALVQDVRWAQYVNI